MPAAAKILTIEDEPAIRSGIVAYLEDSGFVLLQAPDGHTGLEVFRREHPDVVLCDLRLPGMDGLEVLSTLTAESPETPVIIVSGVSLLGYAVQALKRGAWDYVTKPIADMGVLENAINKVLERAELMRENREYREHLEALNRKLSRTLEQLQQDEEAGRRIQFQLLPPQQRDYGPYGFRHRLYPSMYLSGDFVDYFALDERHLGFYMADVSGHGAASAFVTVMLTTLLGQYREAYRTDADQTILQPRETLRRLNGDLCRQRLDKYVTMFYGVIDREHNTMQCSSGGQYPYPILHDGEVLRPLACRSRPVGLFEDSEFQQQEVQLPERFTLWLVSDGLLELLPQPSLAEKHAALNAQIQDEAVSIEGLTAELGIEREDGLPDDVTLLTVTREPAGD